MPLLLLSSVVILLGAGWIGYSRILRGSALHFSIMLSVAGIAAFVCYWIGEQKADEGGFLAGIVGFAMMLALGLCMIGMAMGAGIAGAVGRRGADTSARPLRLALEAVVFYLLVGGAIFLSLIEKTGLKYGPEL